MNNINYVKNIVNNYQIADGCRVKMCRFVESEECGVCHSLFMKECHIQMEYTYKPIKEQNQTFIYILISKSA